MKFSDIINNQNQEPTTPSQNNENRRPFFNGKIEGEVIVHYPRFKVVEKGEYRSLICFGDYYTADGKDTGYSLSVIITNKSINYKDTSEVSRRNMQRLYMVAMALIPDELNPDKEYMDYFHLLDSLTTLINTKVKGKNIRLSVESNEFKDRYYYYVKEGLSIVPEDKVTLPKERSFPDIEATIQKEIKKSISEVSVKPQDTQQSNPAAATEDNIYRLLDQRVSKPNSDIEQSSDDLPW